MVIHFVTKAKIGALHRTYFDDPSPTDCISFPMDTPSKEALLGEVFVCPAVAVEYAKEHGLDPKNEVLLYVIHGLLHLLGYDDCDPKSRKEMRRQEKQCLRAAEERGRNGRKWT